MNAYNLNQTNSSDIIAPFLSEDHSAELRNSGLDDDAILASQIFTVTNKNEGKKLTGYPLTGLVIPYFDPTGKPYTTSKGKPYYRIKPDWGNDPDKDEKPKYLSPKDEGSRPYFAPTFSDWSKALRTKRIPFHVTEGEKKADKQGAENYAAIGLCGVYGWLDKSLRNSEVKGVPAQLIEDEDPSEAFGLEDSRPLPELSFIDDIDDLDIWDGREVYITFDSDIIHKWQVKAALGGFAEWLESKGAEPYIVLLPTELDGSKNGVDDFMVRHGKKAYDELVRFAKPALVPGKGKKKSLNLTTDPDLPQKAALLKSVLKEHWRYRPGIGWHHWEGTHWKLTDDGAGTFIEADIYRFMDANRWQSQGNGAKSNLLSHMKAKLLVEHWNPKHLIAFRNGVLDTSRGIFRGKHCREDFITIVRPYDYNPLAICPDWLRFLREALRGDESAVELVQAMFKRALMPKEAGKYDLEVCWDLYGKPGTGKGTVLDTLKKVVGEANCGTFNTASFKNDNALAALLDKPVSICYDDHGYLEDVGKFNSIITNEPIPIKILWKNAFSTTLNTFLVRAYNNFIAVPSSSQGLDRRIIAMSFDRQPDQIDDTLAEKLEAELAGIFNWAWNLSTAEMKRRIRWAGSVEAVKVASTERFLANNPAFEFLIENYPNGAKEKRIRELYKEYQFWAQEKGNKPLGESLFKRSIQNFGCEQSKEKKDGYYLYSIPKMAELDVARFLKLKPSTSNAAQPETPEKEVISREIPSTSPVNPSTENCVSLENNLDSEPVIEDLEDLRDLRELSPPPIISFPDVSSQDVTLFPLGDFSSTDTNPHSHDKAPIVSSPNVPVKNDDFAPYEIAFRTAKEAKQWKEVIEIKYSEANGILTKYARKLETTPNVPKYIYYLYFRRLRATAIEWLNQQNFNGPPPARRG
jgi:putative DNA primase/helicase